MFVLLAAAALDGGRASCLAPRSESRVVWRRLCCFELAGAAASCPALIPGQTARLSSPITITLLRAHETREKDTAHDVLTSWTWTLDLQLQLQLHTVAALVLPRLPCLQH